MRSLHSKPCWERLQAYAASVLAWQASTTAERGDDTLFELHPHVLHALLLFLVLDLGASCVIEGSLAWATAGQPMRPSAVRAEPARRLYDAQ